MLQGSTPSQGTMKYFFTSDTHAFHDNIIRYSNRPFASVMAMNETMATNINIKVDRSDYLFHLGDWSFGPVQNAERFRSMINCRNVHLIVGNHDRKFLKEKQFTKLFSKIDGLYEGTVEDQFMVLCHYAMRVWNRSHYGAYHL